MEIRSYPRPPKEVTAVKLPEETPKIMESPGKGRERILRRRKVRKETRAQLLLVRTIALGTVTGILLIAFVVIGILRTKDDGGQGWKDPNTSRYQAYSGAKKVRAFPSPSGEEIVSLVRQVLAMRNAGEFRDLVRLKGISESEAVEFLRRLPQEAGKVTGVTWQNAENVNGLQMEGALIDFEKGTKTMAYLTPDGAGTWQVDLASLAVHCSVEWEEFYSGSDRAAELRVAVRRDTYYNGPYADESAWTAYSMACPGSDRVLMGYCKKGSPADKALEQILKNRGSFPVVLRASKTTGAASRQVEILSVLAEGWVLTDTPYDEAFHSEAPPEGS